MNMKLFAVAAAAAFLTMAGAANATITVTGTSQDQLAVNVGSLLDVFDGYVAPNVSFTGNVVPAFVPIGSISNSAPPPYSGGALDCCQGGNPYLADDTAYESVQGSQTSTFSANPGYALTSFSFYMGSPDTYNSMTFNIIGAAPQTLNGTAIWNGDDFAGDRTKGFRVYYDFHGAKVSSITFGSGSDAFEADNFGGTLTAVPEPASWALMIVGFGAAGAMLRGKRRSALTA